MITFSEIDIGGERSKVWTGGEGDALLLVHGAWGGAEAHWSRVWGRLTERFRVIAPELPGIGDRSSPGLRSFNAYAEWLARLLGALDVPRAWCVGNSFGAPVVWQLAPLLGTRCSGVVLVNGAPSKYRFPALLRGLATFAAGKRLVRSLYVKTGFNPGILPRVYADPALAPDELKHLLADPPPALVALIVNVLAADVRPAAPSPAPLLIVWGEADRLPGLGPDVARKFHRSVMGARLAVIPSAGHYPQMEQPSEFVEAIAEFVASASPILGGVTSRPARARPQ